MSGIGDLYPAVRYVDGPEKEESEECRRCKGGCGFIGLSGVWACPGFRPMTNYDRLHEMSREKLGEWLDSNMPYHNGDMPWSVWLEQEVDA